MAWDGDSRVKWRSQASLAASADGERWTLVNASPDLRAQIAATPSLHPRGAVRDSPIEAVVLTGSEIDQTAGLLSLREGQRFALCATAAVLGRLASNPMFRVLDTRLVERRAVQAEQPLAISRDLVLRLFEVPGKTPLYAETEGIPEMRPAEPETYGIEIVSAKTRVVFVPACAAITPPLRERLAQAQVILFDGTLYSDDEMIRAGIGQKTGRRMGHMPIAGSGGSLAALAGLRARRIYIHINNSNPILVSDSAERRTVESAGWEIAEDGMELPL
jgi:pyrroloquinoline quinone biosynthesis protein B